MKKQIRRSVFETNSSSIHSIAIKHGSYEEGIDNFKKWLANPILVFDLKEFGWEAHLWFDLARTGRPMTRTDISGEVPTRIEAGDYRWAKPLPRREFTVNPNLKPQNDGYPEE